MATHMKTEPDDAGNAINKAGPSRGSSSNGKPLAKIDVECKFLCGTRSNDKDPINPKELVKWGRGLGLSFSL
eukprot:11209116-Lingulodinium_polyedra.AAC.1